MRSRSHRLLVSAVAVTALVPAADAAAQEQPPPGDSAIRQYVETLPTSGGGSVVGSATKTGRNLSPKVKKKIEKAIGKKKAANLGYVATSTAYGAPAAKARKALRKGGRSVGAAPTNKLPSRPVFTPQEVRQPEASPEEALSTAVSSATDVTEARIAGLFALVVLISAAALTLAAQRRKHGI